MTLPTSIPSSRPFFFFFFAVLFFEFSFFFCFFLFMGTIFLSCMRACRFNVIMSNGSVWVARSGAAIWLFFLSLSLLLLLFLTCNHHILTVCSKGRKAVDFCLGYPSGKLMSFWAQPWFDANFYRRFLRFIAVDYLLYFSVPLRSFHSLYHLQLRLRLCVLLLIFFCFQQGAGDKVIMARLVVFAGW